MDCGDCARIWRAITVSNFSKKTVIYYGSFPRLAKEFFSQNNLRAFVAYGEGMSYKFCSHCKQSRIKMPNSREMCLILVVRRVFALWQVVTKTLYTLSNHLTVMLKLAVHMSIGSPLVQKNLINVRIVQLADTLSSIEITSPKSTSINYFQS